MCGSVCVCVCVGVGVGVWVSARQSSFSLPYKTSLDSNRGYGANTRRSGVGTCIHFSARYNSAYGPPDLGHHPKGQIIRRIKCPGIFWKAVIPLIRLAQCLWEKVRVVWRRKERKECVGKIFRAIVVHGQVIIKDWRDVFAGTEFDRRCVLVDEAIDRSWNLSDENPRRDDVCDCYKRDGRAYRKI